jgi:transcriptional regulator with XRE-family HTH domain
MTEQSLGTRLRSARTTARMSQTDVERASGIPKTMLSRYENDHVSPSIESLRRLAAALGIAESTLLDDAGSLAEFLFRELQARGVLVANQAQAIRIADAIAAQTSRTIESGA